MVHTCFSEKAPVSAQCLHFWSFFFPVDITISNCYTKWGMHWISWLIPMIGCIVSSSFLFKILHSIFQHCRVTIKNELLKRAYLPEFFYYWLKERSGGNTGPTHTCNSPLTLLSNPTPILLFSKWCCVWGITICFCSLQRKSTDFF